WSPPAWRFNERASPRAITRPWSTTTMSSARRSASSRYCVVSRIVTPPATRFSSTSHRSLRARGSRPVVGSSRNRISGAATSVEADRAAYGRRFGLHVEPRDASAALVGRGQRREYPDGGGFARAVGSQQRADGAARDLEVDAGERGGIAVALDEPGGFNGVHGT